MSASRGIRLVTFDALHTLITPRAPIHVQYSNTFAPYLGVLDPDALKRSFKAALKDVHQSDLTYAKGSQTWWGEVIKRTALDAGADPRDVDEHLSEIVPRLLKVFSSREGYKAFDDALPQVSRLKELNISTAVVSNADSRMHMAIRDLELSPFLGPIVLSEETKVAKPSPEIFLQAMHRVDPSIKPGECLHVGDELEADYRGATAAGLHALLLRRPVDTEAHIEHGEDLTGVPTIEGLQDILDWLHT
ncbi:HAD-like domain-containing protein [Schizophyllum fasciatum]